jgi:transcriptional regulator with GAF, ATPase, and Fis domain
MSTHPPAEDRRRETALVEAFLDIADTMVADYDVVDLLHRLTRHAVHLLDVDAAGLLAADGRGNLSLLASSNEQARLVELFQLEADDGSPCLDCYRSGKPVTAVDLSRWAGRWPGFVGEAQRQGFHTVHALPLRLRTRTIGALNLFRTGNTGLTSSDADLGQALADIAAISILQQRALAHTEVLVEQLQGALNSRVVIEQAKGLLAHAGQLTMDEAFAVLREYARAHNRRLSELARTVTLDHEQARLVLASSRSQP